MIKPIFILIILPALGLSLRVTTDPRPPLYSSSQYERQLEKVQSSFESRIEELNSLIAEIDEIIKDKSTQKNQKLIKMTEKMADERDALYNIEQQIKIPFQLTPCDYQPINPEKRDELNEKVEVIEEKFQALKEQLKICSENACPRFQELNTQTLQIQGYLTTIKQIINSNCRREKYKFVDEEAVGFVRIQNSLKKNNLKAENWYYNVGGEEQYRLKLFEKTSKLNITSCPLEKPYVDESNNECFQCQVEGAMYNVNQMKCFWCESALNFLNLTTSKCQNCPEHHFYDKDLRRCAACPFQEFLNEETQQCQSCNTEEGEYFDKEQYMCKKSPESE